MQHSHKPLTMFSPSSSTGGGLGNIHGSQSRQFMPLKAQPTQGSQINQDLAIHMKNSMMSLAQPTGRKAKPAKKRKSPAKKVSQTAGKKQKTRKAGSPNKKKVNKAASSPKRRKNLPNVL
jgi:hypothetical protein